MNLWAALALAAAAALLVLALHGWWRVRRAGPRPSAARHSRFAASTLDTRSEPPLEPHFTPPVLDDAITQPGDLTDAVTARAAARRVPRLDALIDALVPLVLEAPVTAEHVLAHAPATRRAGTKPFYIEGLDTESGEWEPLAPGRRFGELQAGVQLAHRGGALNEIEYSEFVQKVEALAEAIGARADVPDMLEVVARARELDQLAAPLDAQLSLTLKSNSVAWGMGFVQQVAQRAGLVPGSVAGRWVLPADEDGAPPLITLSIAPQAALAEDPQAAAVREAWLALDVPQTPAAVEPFPAWHLLSKQLCDELDATACDDQGQPITLHAFDQIGREINELYIRLEQLGLPAGSPAARRLFS